MFRKIFTLIFWGYCLSGYTQDVSFDLQKPIAIDITENESEWNSMKNISDVSFANSNYRYAKNVFPKLNYKNSDTLIAWKGEKVHTQLLVLTKTDIKSLRISVDDLKSTSGNIIHSKCISTGFVGYVMSDVFGNGCGFRNNQLLDSFLVADPIHTNIKSIPVSAQTVQPVWISVQIPETAKPGMYTTSIRIFADKPYTLKLKISVQNKLLPPPAKWKFELDLWQHPAAIARIHNVKLWSNRHFDLMKKYYTMLADIGQKNITASIVNEPWGHQTYDDYPGLIKWIKKTDGCWEYDYSLFDKYVSFVMRCGINKRINCYSMVPWKVAISYFDENLQRDTVFTGQIGSREYNEFWKSMLTDFTKHLKEKGWFTITAIAMDERPMESMISVIHLLKSIDSEWKIALAGVYHPEIEKDLFDYCIASRWQFPDSVLTRRKSEGKVSTWYTCCIEKYPNGFTFSPPAEHDWIGWYSAAKNMDGYLRWAYNSWPQNPVTDSRFRKWPAGDAFQVYPGPESSIRFEKLIEGIQDYEKIRILKEIYKNNPAKSGQIENILSTFELSNLSEISAEETVIKAKSALNEL